MPVRWSQPKRRRSVDFAIAIAYSEINDLSFVSLCVLLRLCWLGGGQLVVIQSLQRRSQISVNQKMSE